MSFTEAVIWISESSQVHCIVDGRRQGSSNMRVTGQALHPKARSPLCKLAFFQSCSNVYSLLNHPSLPLLSKSTYHECKARNTPSIFSHHYRANKGQAFGNASLTPQQMLEYQSSCRRTFLTAEFLRLSDLPAYIQSISRASPSPLLGWIVSGPAVESFHVDGTLYTLPTA